VGRKEGKEKGEREKEKRIRGIKRWRNIPPQHKEAARPLPSKMPPAATTYTGPPVNGDLLLAHKSTTLGMRIDVATSPIMRECKLNGKCRREISVPV
jgi:hypothetical protein